MSDKVYKYAIYARFLSDGEPSKKEYKYYLSEDQIEDMCEWSYWMMMTKDKEYCRFPVWFLETLRYSGRGNNSTYSNPVIFTRLEKTSKEEYEKDQRPHIVKCYPGVDEKDDFILINDNILPHGITNVQSYFDEIREDGIFDFWDLLFVNEALSTKETKEDMTKSQAETICSCNCASESLVWDGTSFGVMDFNKVNANNTTYDTSASWNDSITAIDSTYDNTISSVKVSPIIADDYNINGCVKIDSNDVYVKSNDTWINLGMAASNATDQINELKEAIEELKNGKEEKNMLNTNAFMKDFNFGKASGVKMSMYGPAFQSMDNKGNVEWIALEAKSGDWVDATALMMNVDIPFYQMPVAKDKIAVNDFIKHNSSWVRVIDFDEATAYPIVEDIYMKEVKTILPTKSPFGFDFYTKLVNIMGDMNFAGSKDQPFGNMLPLMLMNGGKMDDMLPLMFMMNGGKMDMSNPMMLMALCGDGKMKDMLPFMMMMKETK